MLRKIGVLGVAVVALGLAACGGTNSPTGKVASSNQRGTLVDNPALRVASVNASAFAAQLSATASGPQLLQLAGTPACGVDFYYIKYWTVAPDGSAQMVSGSLMVPTGSASPCTGPRPIVLYAHGTSTGKAYNIADLTSGNNSEALLLAAVFAAQGYIVVAPNYAGYDTSTLSYHPYLVGDQQSHEMMDALTAARSAFSNVGASGSGKLFVTGYSQGGYVALATLRAMQAAGTTVTAAAPMSGPYALSAFGDAIFMGEVNGSAVINFTLVVTAYQHSYGNIYTNTTDVFSPQYAAGIATLLPSNMTNSTLYSEGLLPQNAMFSNTPPAPQYASMTPATTPASLAPVFALGFGPNPLVTNAYRLSYLQDEQAHPDGGFPTTTTDVPPADAANGLREDLAKNDLRSFNPSVPVLLCGGDSDPTGFYLNTLLMQGDWAAHAPNAQLTVLDVDSAVGANDPYADVKNGFAAAKAAVAAAAIAGGATDGGHAAVLTDYHAGLVPPFCLYSVEKFFSGS